MAKPHVPIPMPFAPSNETERRLSPHVNLQPQDVVLQQNVPKLCWYDHLKNVLLRKAFLVYVTLAETHFLKRIFGRALR